MFDLILDPITEFIRDMLKGWIEDNLFGLFSGLNYNVANVALEVSQTPSSWNGGVFNIIQNLSETVIIPVGAVIITYVLCYELISMLIDRNNMHEFDTSLFLKYIFKAGIAVFLLSKTSDIVMAVFDLGSSMSLKAGAEIYDSTSIPDVWSDVVAWYDGIWQIGMLLPIILIYLYNGESGKKNIVNKWSFYLFYPIHFHVFWLILIA